MTHKIFRWFASLFIALTLSLSGFTPALAAPPANDNFANAEVITSFPFSVTADNTDATAEPDEPSGCIFPVRSVWYAFTPTENMAVRVDMVGSAVEGVVNIFLASGPGISDLTSVACAGSDGSDNFQAEAGKTYYLQVDSFFQAGVLQVNLQQITPPANDNFANAEVIGSLPFSAVVDNTDATIEPGEVSDCASQFRSVWYAFSPTENAEVRMSTLGSTAPGNVSIYLASGSSISDLTFLRCAAGSSSPDIQLEAGKTYYLRVDSFEQAGAIQVNLEQISPSAEVTIDIKPGSQTNPINLKSVGKIPVAILSTADFNALSEVDKTSLTFGRTGDENSLAFCNKGGEDVNGDGLLDLVCHFKTKLTGFQIGDTEGILRGQTLDGVSIEGRDLVRILK